MSFIRTYWEMLNESAIIVGKAVFFWFNFYLVLVVILVIISAITGTKM